MIKILYSSKWKGHMETGSHMQWMCGYCEMVSQQGDKDSATEWNAKHDKNRLFCQLDHLTISWTLARFMGSKYVPENTYFWFWRTLPSLILSSFLGENAPRITPSWELSKDHSLEQSQLQEDQALQERSLMCYNLALESLICFHLDFQHCRLKLTLAISQTAVDFAERGLQAAVSKVGQPVSTEQLDKLFELSSKAVVYAILLEGVTPDALPCMCSVQFRFSLSTCMAKHSQDRLAERSLEHSWYRSWDQGWAWDQSLTWDGIRLGNVFQNASMCSWDCTLIPWIVPGPWDWKRSSWQNNQFLSHLAFHTTEGIT